MPSTLHEGLVTLFLDDPGLSIRLVTAIDGCVLTRTPSRLVDRHVAFQQDAEQVLRMRGRTMDALFVLEDPEHPQGGFAIIIEVQLGDDSNKRRRIASYLGMVVDRHDLPVHLGVVCLEDRVAQKLAGWRVGTALSVHPYLFDRRSIPRVNSVKDGLLQPVDAILSGTVHGYHGDLEAATIALEVAHRQPPKLRQRYTSTVLAALPKSPRELIMGALPRDQHMQLSHIERQSGTFLLGCEEGLEKGLEEGLEKGLEKARQKIIHLVQTLLAQRGLPPSEAERARIESGTLDQLEFWASHVLTVNSVAELLALSSASPSPTSS